MVRRGLALAAAAIAMGCCALPARAADGRDDPIVFVHGLNPFFGAGYPCTLNWNAMKSVLLAAGWDTEMTSLRYYVGDFACDDDFNHHGDHNAHHGNNRPFTFGFNHSIFDRDAHDDDTHIEHLGYHLAWYIYDQYTAAGRTVDLVGHSMGGVVIRYALTRVERHDPDFPPDLLVEDVVTLETPHAGAPLSVFIAWSRQARELLPGSAFLRGLGRNPQVGEGTDWTAIGSYWDPLVSADSAVAIDAAHKIKYREPFYEHLLGLWDESGGLDARFDRSDGGGTWRTWLYGPHSLQAIDLALASSSD